MPVTAIGCIAAPDAESFLAASWNRNPGGVSRSQLFQHSMRPRWIPIPDATMRAGTINASAGRSPDRRATSPATVDVANGRMSSVIEGAASAGPVRRAATSL
jgi:hypothetical protein